MEGLLDFVRLAWAAAIIPLLVYAVCLSICLWRFMCKVLRVDPMILYRSGPSYFGDQIRVMIFIISKKYLSIGDAGLSDEGNRIRWHLFMVTTGMFFFVLLSFASVAFSAAGM